MSRFGGFTRSPFGGFVRSPFGARGGRRLVITANQWGQCHSIVVPLENSTACSTQGIVLDSTGGFWMPANLLNHYQSPTTLFNLKPQAVPYIGQPFAAGAGNPTLPSQSMVSAPDGNIWFSPTGSGFGGRIVSMTPAGVQTTHNFSQIFGLTSGSALDQFFGGIIRVGPSGQLWTVVTAAHFIALGIYSFQNWLASFDLSGNNTNAFMLSGLPGTSTGVTTGFDYGSDGNLWFTIQVSASPAQSKLCRITPAGALTVYVYNGALFTDLRTAPDGNLWIGDLLGGVWKVSPGSPASGTYLSIPCNITKMVPDAARNCLWAGSNAFYSTQFSVGNAPPFVEGTTNSIFKINMDGTYIQYPIGSPIYNYDVQYNTFPFGTGSDINPPAGVCYDLAVANDGSIWANALQNIPPGHIGNGQSQIGWILYP